MRWTADPWYLPVRRFPDANVAFDSATLAWIAAVVANGGTVSNARQTTVNNLIVGLKTDGIWTLLDRLWLFAAENAASALTDLVADALATAVPSGVSPAFQVDRGYTGVDASATVYIDTGFNASTAGGQFTQNAAHLSLWNLTNTSSGPSGGYTGAADNTAGVAKTYIVPKFSDGRNYGEINDAAFVGVNPLITDPRGHMMIVRTAASGAGAIVQYVNGAQTATGTDTSGTLANCNFYALAIDSVGSGANSGAGFQTAMMSFGGTFSGTNSTNFYNRLRTYMTAVGVS